MRTIEDKTTIEKNKEHKQKIYKRLIVIGSVAVIVLCGFLGVFLFNLNNHTEEKEEIKEVYKKVEVDLSDDDFVIEDNKPVVKDEKKQEAKKKSEPTLKKINEEVAIEDFVQESPDIAQPEEEITPDDLTNKINAQLGYIKGCMERSTNKELNEYYARPLQVLMHQMSIGDLDGVYDAHDAWTNEYVYGVLCYQLYGMATTNDTTFIWQNFYPQDVPYTSNFYYNLLLKKIYENPITVDFITEDTSKKCKLDDTEIESTYMVIAGNVKFYLDGGCNIMDAEYILKPDVDYWPMPEIPTDPDPAPSPDPTPDPEPDSEPTPDPEPTE